MVQQLQLGRPHEEKDQGSLRARREEPGRRVQLRGVPRLQQLQPHCRNQAQHRPLFNLVTQ